ncbi:hypothetical protein Nepgr_017921 [Nepenthes gracilis]|uniref:Uncharacterized protein n=1 Tax=Nepenthes gracilis TaxID=150966 RepID=A0AAD3XTU7_NEPGR|nr:hypothetical protein Nepgr_017921 [Nepenthes gracilis]
MIEGNILGAEPFGVVRASLVLVCSTAGYLFSARQLRANPPGLEVQMLGVGPSRVWAVDCYHSNFQFVYGISCKADPFLAVLIRTNIQMQNAI